MNPNSSLPRLAGLVRALALMGLAGAAWAQSPGRAADRPAAATTPVTAVEAAPTAPAAPAAPITFEAAEPAAGLATESAWPPLVWSAFGTIGWAQSNRPWHYQRFIDKHGGFERDTVFGAQLDAQLSPEWSATLQTRVAPSARADNAWDLRASWAFLGWRPNNDWMVRAGKLRVPLFLRSEHLDVGQTYDQARLPAEIYSLAPTTDFTGVHLSRSWDLGSGELSLDAYRGRAAMVKRMWMRDGLPPQVPAGETYRDAVTTAQGLVATWVAPSAKARLGMHRVRTTLANSKGMLVRPTWVQLGPGFGYWQTDAALPGPGVETVPAINNYLLVAGSEFSLKGGWRVGGELARVVQRNTDLGVDSWAGNLTVSREWGHFTPYVSYSALRSKEKSRRWVSDLDTTTVPAVVPGAAMLDATMRAAADGIPAYNQRSWALGSAYTLTPRSKLKAEWMRTRAEQSGMFDLPSEESLVAPRSVDVFSLSYSFVY